MDDITFRFRDCECPGTPHAEGDTVSLRPFLGWDAGAQALRILTECMGQEQYLNEKLAPVYLTEGVSGWNLVDEDGSVPFDSSDVLALPFEQALMIAEKCDDLYSARITAPLVARTNALSASTPTAGTSRTSRSTRRHLAPVERSSPDTSADGKRRAV